MSSSTMTKLCFGIVPSIEKLRIQSRPFMKILRFGSHDEKQKRRNLTEEDIKIVFSPPNENFPIVWSGMENHAFPIFARALWTCYVPCLIRNVPNKIVCRCQKTLFTAHVFLNRQFI